MKLIVTDLDQTLLDYTKSIPAGVAERIAAATYGRARCTIATGRDLERTRGYVQQLGWEGTPVIVEQGAVVARAETGEILLERFFNASDIAALTTFLLSVTIPLNVLVFRHRQLLAFRTAGSPCFFGADAIVDLTSQMRLLEEIRADDMASVHKVSLRCLPPDLSQLQELISQQFAASMAIVKADVDFLNVLLPGVNKGTALQWLMNELDVEPGQVMAIGDCEADVPMLKVAGVPVVVANADEATRSCARYVVPSNEEGGVAVAVERFMAGEFST